MDQNKNDFSTIGSATACALRQDTSCSEPQTADSDIGPIDQATQQERSALCLLFAGTRRQQSSAQLQNFLAAQPLLQTMQQESL